MIQNKCFHFNWQPIEMKHFSHSILRASVVSFLCVFSPRRSLGRGAGARAILLLKDKEFLYFPKALVHLCVMGAQWKHAPRLAASSKRASLTGKLVKEIMVAAKIGGASPDANARLWAAIETAKKQSVPRDTIERAIKKGSGQLDEAVHYELVTYEGFAPHKVPVIVECLTDNRNRTAPDIRNLFKGGQLGAMGSVTWMFEHMGVVEATHTDKSLDLETVAIEAGAQNVEPLEASEIEPNQIGARFFCDRTDLDKVTKFLKDAKWSVTTSEMSYVAKERVDLSEDHKHQVTEFLSAIDDHDDVHRIYTALK
jgi:YebC/PmpR family DNA-binding regulatory protein